jgi:integrase
MLRPWVLTQTFKRLVRELPSLPEIHFHSLRHTAATTMLMAGVAPKTVQDQLGHKTLATTMDTYAHVIPAQRDSSADAVERLYRQGHCTLSLCLLRPHASAE